MGKTRVTVAAMTVAAVAVLLVPRVARGEDAKEARWRGAADVGTDFPLSINLRGHVEAPFRLRLSTSVGILPKPYVSVVNAILVGAGAYTSSTADLITLALKSSLIWRTHAGYRPFESLGLYGEAGYGLVTLGGGASTAELITGVTGKTLPQTDADTSKELAVKSTLHMLDVEIGWDFTLAERLHLRTAIGGAFTVASSTTVTPKYTPRAPRLTEAFTQYAADYLDDTYTSYVFSPILAVGVGYAF